MATTPRFSVGQKREVEYPTSDGRPMAETETHARDMMDLIQTLQDRFVADPDVYAWGNLLLFYERGNRRKHISPDVFVVRGVPKEPPRDHYLIWKEGKSPDLVIEITSKTTKSEDQNKKWLLYRDVLKVAEYIQFDPNEDYLHPSMQGHRLIAGEYVPIELIAHRLPSEVLGLHFEREGAELRLFDPVTRRRLLTRAERIAKSETELERTVELMEARDQLPRAEIERLRLEIEDLRKRLSGTS